MAGVSSDAARPNATQFVQCMNLYVNKIVIVTSNHGNVCNSRSGSRSFPGKVGGKDRGPMLDWDRILRERDVCHNHNHPATTANMHR